MGVTDETTDMTDAEEEMVRSMLAERYRDTGIKIDEESTLPRAFFVGARALYRVSAKADSFGEFWPAWEDLDVTAKEEFVRAAVATIGAFFGDEVFIRVAQ